MKLMSCSIAHPNCPRWKPNFRPCSDSNWAADYGKEELTMYLQPLTAIHLDNSLPAGIQPVSNPKYSYILATIGLLILRDRLYQFHHAFYWPVYDKGHRGGCSEGPGRGKTTADQAILG